MATAQETPESDTGSFECFQNYAASEIFIQGLAGIIDQQDVEFMIRAQKQMLQRFEKTNEMLTNCNQLSDSRLKAGSAEFKKHTALLAQMKKNLDFIFTKIRLIKTKMNRDYAYAFTEATRNSLAEEAIAQDMNCGPKPLEPEVLLPLIIPEATIITEIDPDSDVAVEEFQFAKLRKRGMKSNNSSSTESINDNDDTSSSTSDTG